MLYTCCQVLTARFLYAIIVLVRNCHYFAFWVSFSKSRGRSYTFFRVFVVYGWKRAEEKKVRLQKLVIARRAAADALLGRRRFEHD